MRRQQKTATAGYLNEGMLETKSNLGAQSTASPETERKDGVENLLEKMLHRDNLNEAYKRVKNNKGAAGIDNMSVGEMLAYLKENKEELLQSLREGKYKPKAERLEKVIELLEKENNQIEKAQNRAKLLNQKISKLKRGVEAKRKIEKGGVFEAFEREITGNQEITDKDLVYAFLYYVLSDNRNREKLKQLT